MFDEDLLQTVVADLVEAQTTGEPALLERVRDSVARLARRRDRLLLRRARAEDRLLRRVRRGPFALRCAAEAVVHWKVDGLHVGASYPACGAGRDPDDYQFVADGRGNVITCPACLALLQAVGGSA